jgi:hypothetical protein
MAVAVVEVLGEDGAQAGNGFKEKLNLFLLS